MILPAVGSVYLILLPSDLVIRASRRGYRNANGSWRFEGMTSVYRQDMAAFLHRLNERLTK